MQAGIDIEPALYPFKTISQTADLFLAEVSVYLGTGVTMSGYQYRYACVSDGDDYEEPTQHHPAMPQPSAAPANSEYRLSSPFGTVLRLSLLLVYLGILGVDLPVLSFRSV